MTLSQRQTRTRRHSLPKQLVGVFLLLFPATTHAAQESTPLPTRLEAAATPAFTLTISRQTPIWLQQFWRNETGYFLQVLEQYFGYPLKTRPALVFGFTPGLEGALRFTGKTFDTHVSIIAAGSTLQQKSPQGLRLARLNLVHELIHLWQRQDADLRVLPPLLSEGAAEWLTLRVLTNAAPDWGQENTATYISDAVNGCARALQAGRVLPPDWPTQDIRPADYQCGLVLFERLIGWTGYSARQVWQNLAAFSRTRDTPVSAAQLATYFFTQGIKKRQSIAIRHFLSGDFSAGVPLSIIRQFQRGTL